MASNGIFTSNAGMDGLLNLIKAGVVTPMPRLSAALSTTNRITSEFSRVQVPVIRGDASTAWVPEGQLIGESEPDIDTIEASPRALKALTPVSNEALKSGIGDLAALAMNSLSNDLASKVDAAFYANTTANGPKGLGSIAPTTLNPTTFTNLDIFTEAVVTAEGVGSTITSFHCNPTDYLKIANLKESNGSNRGLLQPDVQAENAPKLGNSYSGHSVAGVPLYVSRHCAAGVIWGVPKATVFSVTSATPDLAMSEDAAFDRDITLIRAVYGVDFAFAHEAGVVKIELPTP
ncbi:phage major capsid protein [Prescottella equi]|uniref:phage major capsid protein n=1 Tax=Rhodococcus hoagii TaxID=43767 RepID=UPI000A114621|nr:phage major capsid protein [Prescottella equi]